MQATRDPAFAAVVGLGAFKSDHTPSAASRRKSIVGQLLFAGGALVAVLGSVAGLAYISIKNTDADTGWLLGILCLGCLVLPIGLAGAFNVWRHRLLGAVLYENGFAYKDGPSMQQVGWPEIEAVWQKIIKHYHNGVYTRTTHVYTIETRMKKRIVLDDYLANVEQLGNEILLRSSDELGPRYWQVLQSGQPLAFGPLTISQTGISSGSKRLRWSEIKAIKVQKGIISVKKEGGWFNWTRATVPQIPNFLVFYGLLRRFATVE